MLKKISLFIILTVGFISFSFAQTIRNSSDGLFSNTELNYSIGFSQFYGDASSSGFFKKFSGEIGFAQSLNFKKHFSPVFAVGLNGYYGCVKSHKTISGSGAAIDYNLAGNYGDFNLRAYIDFNNLFWGRDYNRNLSAFGWLGIGYGFWSTGLTNNNNADYREVGDPVVGTTTGEVYKKAGVVMPFGLGLNYRLNEKFAVNIVGDYRLVLNDDVDVWRGGSKSDNLFYIGIGLSYYIKPGFTKAKSRVKKSKPKQVNYQEEKSNKDEKIKLNKKTDKPKVAEPNKKPLGDIPIYDIDFRAAKQAKEDIASKQKAVVDKVEMQPHTYGNVKGVIYRVQILAKSTKLHNVQYLREKYNLSSDILEVYQDGVYRYSLGEFSNYRDAFRYSQNLRNKGLRDAFVVVYKDGKRIKLTKEMKSN